MLKNYNNYRKELLKQLDNNIKLSTVELDMYDLSTYFDKEVFNCSLAEKIIYANLEKNKISHIMTENKYLNNEQARVLNLIKDKNRMVLMAPTSFGKTLLVKEYIFKFKPRFVVIIVPTNSLAYELETSFKNNKAFTDICKYKIFDKLKIGTLSFKDNYIFIGTQEKYLELASHIKKVDFFVIDEAYKLKDSTEYQRNYKLSKVFLDDALTISDKLLLLSPNAIFKGFEIYDFYFESVDFNAVDKEFTVLTEDEFYDEIGIKASEAKTILYCKKPENINRIVDKISYQDNSLCDFASFLAKEFHPDWSVVKFLRKGILVHHGQMPKFVQNKMQYLFLNSDNCKLIIGTNSLSEGINTPAKNVFISSDFTSSEDTMLLKNSIGRAGRLGVYPIGHIYSTKNIEDDCLKNVEISLAVSDDKALEEIKDSNNIDKLNSIAELYSIASEDVIKLIKTLSISLTKLISILELLKRDCAYENITNLVYIASEVFKKDYLNYRIKKDSILIKCYLQNCAYFNNKKIRIDTFKEKILFYSKKTSTNISDSIDDYMSFVYSKLEYCILPIANVYSFIKENYNDFKFGKCVSESFSLFLSKYYLATYGDINFNLMNDNEKKILSTLREYGVSIKSVGINKEMINEIYNLLDDEFSTFDVIEAIKKLSQESNLYKDNFNRIYLNYLEV